MIVSSGTGKHGFDAYGGSVLKAEDMGYWMNDSLRTDPAGICFELGEEVETVEAGFFQLVPTIYELWILNPKCHIYMTDEDIALFKKNDVRIRGAFDSAAENFAKQYQLQFLHINTILARKGDYFQGGIDIISLCFYGDGSAYINQNCMCQGSSAGSTGGGEVDFNLPDDFYLTMTDEDIAGQCWGSCYAEILKKGILRSLMKKAKTKKGFLIDYRPGAKSPKSKAPTSKDPAAKATRSKASGSKPNKKPASKAPSKS